MNTGSPDFVQWQRYRGYLETQGQELSHFRGVKKNSMRLLRDSTSMSLRQEETTHTGFVLRGCQGIFGIGSAAGQMQEVREGEAGGAEVDSEEPLLHEALCFLCREEVPYNDNQGCSEGVEAGLAYSKVIGEGIYEGAASQKSSSSSCSNRDRRSILAEGAYLSNHSK